jgi:hypothetical protein
VLLACKSTEKEERRKKEYVIQLSTQRLSHPRNASRKEEEEASKINNKLESKGVSPLML